MFRLIPMATFREYRYLNIIQHYCMALPIVNGKIYNDSAGKGKDFP